MGGDACNGCDGLIQKSRLKTVSSGHVEVSLRGLPEAAPFLPHKARTGSSEGENRHTPLVFRMMYLKKATLCP